MSDREFTNDRNSEVVPFYGEAEWHDTSEPYDAITAEGNGQDIPDGLPFEADETDDAPAIPPSDVPIGLGDAATKAALGDAEDRSQEVIADPELATLLQQGAAAMGDRALDRVLRANAPFNRPIIIVNEDGSERQEDNWDNKRVLEDLPAYCGAAEAAQIDIEQATDLLVHAMGAVRYPASGSRGLVPKLTKALEASSGAEAGVSQEQLAGLKDMITKASPSDVIEMSVSAYTAARKAGVSAEESVRLVGDHLDTANPRQLGYMMYHFRDALAALDAAGVDPQTTAAVFDHIRDMHPEYRGEAYERVKHALTLEGPASGRTPSEMMQDIARRLRDEETNPPSELPSSEVETEIFAPREQRDSHFREVPGQLENRCTPYRTQRTWSEGVADLARLTDASYARGDAVSEGHWVFDPQTDTWYSHGGETRYVAPGRIRHTSINYDVSELSDTPYSVHIHPKDFAILADKYGFVFPTNADYRAAATLLESTQDSVPMRSFISHPLGLTEFTYPSNPVAMRQVADTFEALRTRFFDQFSDEHHIMAVGNAIGPENFARESVDAINQLLPEGFEIRFYPRGTNPQDIR